jgi:hypothetical protein
VRLKKEDHPKIVISAPQPQETKSKRNVSKSPSPQNSVIKHNCDSEKK